MNKRIETVFPADEMADELNRAKPVNVHAVIKTPTIYDIKYRVKNAPLYFDRHAMKAFGQTLKSFSVRRISNTLFMIHAPIIRDGKYHGQSQRIFNALTDEFLSTLEMNLMLASLNILKGKKE